MLKHDSWAATAIYAGPAGRVVCKFNRQQPILFFPMRWFGRRLARREASFLARLADLPNVPRLAGDVYVDGKRAATAVAHDYVPGHPLGSREPIDAEFFAAIEGLFAELHRRDIAYVDLHKRENILVGDDGRPHLVDFQISFRLPRWWPANAWPMRVLLDILQQSDLYHLQKHWARCRPDLCGRRLAEVVRGRPWWISAHRLVATPWRVFRRKILVALGIRAASGRASSELFPEDAYRAVAGSEGTGASPPAASWGRKAA